MDIETNNIKEKYNNEIKRINLKFKTLDLKHLKDKMINNSSNNMALTDSLNFLEKCLDDHLEEVPEIIKFMLTKLDSGGKFTATEIVRLNNVFEKLPALRFETLILKLKGKLFDADIF